MCQSQRFVPITEERAASLRQKKSKNLFSLFCDYDDLE